MNQSDPEGTPREEFEQALAELEALVRRERAPTRYHARAVLLPLGRLLLAGDAEAATEELERLKRAVGRERERWEAAVREELSLACAEHVLGVDPRYLENPRFDFEYVVAARERLEARLAVASALDLMPPEEILDQIAEADLALAPHLERAAASRPERRRGTGPGE